MERNRHDVIRAASRSIWKERFTKNFHFFCPMCTAPRRIGMHPRPGHPIHFAQIGLTSVVFALALQAAFPWVGLKGLVAFVPFWIAFETIYRAKIRASVTCGKCGFDPVLYLVDVEQARAAIREHWRARFEAKGIPFPEEVSGNRATRYQRGAATSSLESASQGKYGQNPHSESDHGAAPEALE